MQRAICDYHQDQHQDWVAVLSCGHFQHVRHNPPWQNREWVTSINGREEKLGALLECVKCDQGAPADKAVSEIN